ncbi:cytochrome b/b6 domain-containing protein [Rhodoblastus sp.]|jgi:cytochrome b561|uniref:cytochrome b n=1 Tax=Rhodoblastus sp. TaxID=1962975 RepID=UPI0025DC927A|nr:cytochrome b/b6 domain-containing protein [Rhodoblastus sp.]
MTTSERYDSVAIALHWSIAALIGLAFVIGLTVDDFPKEMTGAVINVHALLGLTVLLLSLFRLVWRLGHPAPDLPATMPPLARNVAKITHAGLYLLMVVVPIIGIPTLLWRGRGLDFGLFQIASPFARTPEIFRPLTEVHEIASFALIGLAAAHILAALYHQYIRRDAILTRMSPWRG